MAGSIWMSQAMESAMRLGYADPPYPGQAKRHYGNHPDYAGEVDHVELLKRLDAEYDGWVLHTSSTALADVLGMAANLGITDYRIMAWVKPFAAFKPNVPVAYAWEPVLVKSARKPVVAGATGVMRDWKAENITLKRGLTGVKPEAVCWWLFDCLGALPGDNLDDLYIGSGAVSSAWITWCNRRDTPSIPGEAIMPPKKKTTDEPTAQRSSP